jgi:hypothetical protein
MLCRSFYWISGRKQLLEKFHSHRPTPELVEKEVVPNESEDFEA